MRLIFTSLRTALGLVIPFPFSSLSTLFLLFFVPFFRVQGLINRFLGPAFIKSSINGCLLFSGKSGRPFRGLAKLNIGPKANPCNSHHNTFGTDNFDPRAALKNNGKRLFANHPGKHGSTNTDRGNGRLGLEPARRSFGNSASHYPEDTFLYLRLNSTLRLIPVPDIISYFHFTVAAQAVHGVIIENNLNSPPFPGCYRVLDKKRTSDIKLAEVRGTVQCIHLAAHCSDKTDRFGFHGLNNRP